MCTKIFTFALILVCYSTQTKLVAHAATAEINPALPVTTFIHDIQGIGLTSDFVGKIVTIEGVIVGTVTSGDGKVNGFFVMEEDADADQNPATSEGIFVFAPGAAGDVVGDQLRVTGTVQEPNNLTQIGFASAFENLGVAPGGMPTPAPFLLPSEVNDLERLEGMRVVFQQTLTITDLYTLGRFNEMILATKLLESPANVTMPGPLANELLKANAKIQIILDDDANVQNPKTVRFLSENIKVRRGTTLLLDGVIGVLAESFDKYRVRVPMATKIKTGNVPVRPALPNVGGRLQVASYNVYNLFSTLNQGTNRCGPKNEECRGAATQKELDRQLTKLVAAVTALNAEVVCLQEIENNPTGDPTLRLLVNKLNQALGSEVYDFVATGAVGSDPIKVSIIYQKNKVQPIGKFAVLTKAIDARFDENLHRAALAQTFRETATKEAFTVIVNHLKSKSSQAFSANFDPRDNDQQDGQAFFNFSRTQGAKALMDWAASDPTKSGDPDFLIVGDLNSHRQEDPIRTFEQGGFKNILNIWASNPYSFVFFGEEGQLDYILANAGVKPQITGAAVWKINSDEPRVLDYNNFNQDFLFQPDVFRSADHDPVLLGLNLGTKAENPVVVITNKQMVDTIVFSRDTTYLLEGFVFVEENEVLHIKAGTTITFKSNADDHPSALIVSKGGKIFAQGTPEQPVIIYTEMNRERMVGYPVPSPGLYIFGDGVLNAVHFQYGTPSFKRARL